MPKVSIVVLTYNNFDNLKRNIDSILMQSFKDYEVIIQDDGSNNFNRGWIMSLIPKEYQEIFKVNHLDNNIGTVRNYNNAIKIANGEIIVPLAQDDCFFDENSLLFIVKAFDNRGTCICTSKRIGRKDNIVYPCNEDCDIIKVGGEELFQRLLFMNFISGSVTYYRRSYLLETNLFDEKYQLLEDYPKILEAVMNNISISFLDKITIVYGQDGVVGGKHKSESIASLKLIEDNLNNYRYNILPSIGLVRHRRMKRFIKYYYDSISGKKIYDKIWVRVKNIDIYVISKYVNHKNIDYFSYMYKLLNKD